MTLKEFFRPTKWKIILGLVLLIPYIHYLISVKFLNSEYLPCSLAVIYSPIIVLPFILSNIIGTALAKINIFLFFHKTENCIPGMKLECAQGFYPVFGLDILQFVIQILWIYLLACLIFFVYQKIKSIKK